MHRTARIAPAIVLAVAAGPVLAWIGTGLANAGLPALHASGLFAWAGSGCIATSLLLMIREPAVAGRFGGLERMYRWHHAVGTIGYVLLLAHPLVLAAHFLPADPGTAWFALAPGANAINLAGWIALLGLMAGLAATFALRLPYGLWRMLHMALGAAVLVGIGHALLARGGTLAAWLLVAPAVAGLGWRLLRADRGLGARPYVVTGVAHPANRMTEVTLRPLAGSLAVAPGQFVMLAFFEGPDYRGCGEYHPFTVSGAQADGTLAVTIKSLGDCTRNIQALQAGVSARVQGPFGTFLPKRGAGPLLWIAGGVGIAPFLGALRDGAPANPTSLVYVYRNENDAAYVDELRALAARMPALTLLATPLADDPADLHRLLATVPELAARQVYLCGPPGLLAAAVPFLTAHGVAPVHLHAERFDFR